MGTDLTDCVVTVLDLVGVKNRAPDKGAGSATMRKLHRVVKAAMESDAFCSVRRAYTWNDSVLLLAYLGGDKEYCKRILCDANEFKRKIDDEVGESFAVAVMGQSFPTPTHTSATQASGTQERRFVYIESSSYAMANCLEIPGYFKKHKCVHDWYVDSRIVKKIDTLPEPSEEAKINLLPAQKERIIYAYDGYLWTDSSS